MTLRERLRIYAIPRIYRLAVLIITLTALTLTLTSLAAITVTRDFSSSGTIAFTTSPNIGVYSDSACTNSLSSLNWGSLAAGASTARTVYVKNTGGGAMTLNLGTTNWSPTGANSYITISWDKQGQTLSAGQATAATITLTVSPAITGISSFSNTITLSGTG